MKKHHCENRDAITHVWQPKSLQQTSVFWSYIYLFSVNHVLNYESRNQHLERGSTVTLNSNLEKAPASNATLQSTQRAALHHEMSRSSKEQVHHKKEGFL